MNTRIILSIHLIGIAAILLLLPPRIIRKGQPSPSQQVLAIKETTQAIGVDKAAMLINQGDSNYQFIDLRSSEAFLATSLPGAINIPFEELFSPRWQGYLKQEKKINILYANGDYLSNIACALLSAKGYQGNISLQGGMNAWFETIMKVEFAGGHLSARENALIENRMNAKKLFTRINSLPDSLKNNFLEAKLIAENELDGGCE